MSKSVLLLVSKSEDGEEKPNPRILDGYELFQYYGVINPQWKMKLRWDLGMNLLVLLFGFIGPFEVAFLKPKLFNGMWFLNRLIDLLFLIDLSLQFVVAYYSDQESRMIYDRKLIAQRYLRGGWFVVDFLTIIPYDTLLFYKVITNSVRILRVAKLLRLGQSYQLLRVLTRSMTIDYSAVKLFQFLFMVLLCSHWMACLWMLVPELERAASSWLNKFLVPPLDSDVAMAAEHPLTGERVDSTCLEAVLAGSAQCWEAIRDALLEVEKDRTDRQHLTRVYVASLYWSAMTVTTIGYGDLIPVSSGEQVYDIFAMIVGALVFGYVIGAVGNVVQQRSARENEYQFQMSNLNYFMTDLRLPTTLQTEIRTYFQRLHSRTELQEYHTYNNMLSPKLQSRMLQATATWIERIPHFRSAPEEFLVSVASILTRQLYPPQEVIIEYKSMARDMYIVNRGIAAGNNHLFTVGSIIGNDALVRGESERFYSAHAITFLEVSMLSKDQMFEVLEHFPEMNQRFRILAIKYMFREEVLAYCVAMRAVKTKRKRSRAPRSQPPPLTPAQRRASAPALTSPRSLSRRSFRRSQIAVGDLSPGADEEEEEEELTEEDLEEMRRVSDLFNKSARTEFYAQKLEMIFPETVEQQKKVEASVRLIQRRFRAFSQKKHPDMASLVLQISRLSGIGAPGGALRAPGPPSSAPRTSSDGRGPLASPGRSTFPADLPSTAAGALVTFDSSEALEDMVVREHDSKRQLGEEDSVGLVREEDLREFSQMDGATGADSKLGQEVGLTGEWAAGMKTAEASPKHLMTMLHELVMQQHRAMRWMHAVQAQHDNLVQDITATGQMLEGLALKQLQLNDYQTDKKVYPETGGLSPFEELSTESGSYLAAELAS